MVPWLDLLNMALMKNTVHMLFSFFWLGIFSCPTLTIIILIILVYRMHAGCVFCRWHWHHPRTSASGSFEPELDFECMHTQLDLSFYSHPKEPHSEESRVGCRTLRWNLCLHTMLMNITPVVVCLSGDSSTVGWSGFATGRKLSMIELGCQLDGWPLCATQHGTHPQSTQL